MKERTEEVCLLQNVTFGGTEYKRGDVVTLPEWFLRGENVLYVPADRKEAVFGTEKKAPKDAEKKD